jgi:hypothetical protein
MPYQSLGSYMRLDLIRNRKWRGIPLDLAGGTELVDMQNKLVADHPSSNSSVLIVLENAPLQWIM